MAAHLFKTEPSTYSHADLARDQRTVWDGVSNPLALRNLRAVREGDTVVIYHTGAEKAAVGLAVALSDGRPDPKDPSGKLVVVDLGAGHAFGRPVPLATFKTDPLLRSTELARLPRLSVMPLSDEHMARVLQLAGGGTGPPGDAKRGKAPPSPARRPGSRSASAGRPGSSRT